ncbi:transcriptional repressor CTCF-like [Contarinia nasturtii]|uniref:transcriptional repressor CTCF-like n=1 Tax=Contarinia nasturtii TaxID=265458 RepID=UPI0012D4B53F|nr:transcriptional repressor CTCF-like [Contarinia nasturtii]
MDLKKDMRKHTGEKPFRCEICMKRFTQKNSLKTHLNNIHTRLNPIFLAKYIKGRDKRMLSWSDEMDIMLAAFDRQAKVSLKNIKMALKRTGLSFNPGFKQYFLDASYDRIKNTYNQFEVNQLFEEHNDFGADLSMADRSQISSSVYQNGHYMTNSVEIIDSSDEDDGTMYPKVEPSETTSPFQYNNIGATSELNDFFQNDDEGSYNEMPETYSNGLNGRKDVTQSKARRRNKIINHNEMKAEEAEMDDGFNSSLCDLNYDMDTTNEPTSTVTSNNRPNFVDATGKMQSRPTPRSLGKKKPSNQFEVKKRFTCDLCEYSSNRKGDLKKHTRTHTGEKPYQCDICRKEFTNMQSLKNHKLTHTEEFPFHCRGCFEGFPQKTERDDHEKLCKARCYECHICKKFVNVGITHLKRHMLKHNGKKSFRCEICMKSFTQKCNLKAHLKTIHSRINA